MAEENNTGQNKYSEFATRWGKIFPSRGVQVVSGKEPSDGPTVQDVLLGISSAVFFGKETETIANLRTDAGNGLFGKLNDFINDIKNNINNSSSAPSAAGSIAATGGGGSSDISRALVNNGGLMALNVRLVDIIGDAEAKINSIISSKSSSTSSATSTGPWVPDKNKTRDISYFLTELSSRLSGETPKPDKLTAWREFIGGPDIKNSLHGIIDSIAACYKDIETKLTEDEQSNVKVLSNAIAAVLDILNFDAERIDLKALQQLQNVTAPDGNIQQIIRNIASFEITKDEYERIDATVTIIGNFFNAMNRIADLGLLSAFRINFLIFTVRRFVLKQLHEFLMDFNKQFADMNIDIKQRGGLYNLHSFFHSLADIGEISIKSKLKFSANLFYIKKFLIGQLVDLIKYFDNSFKDAEGKSGAIDINTGGFKVVSDFIQTLLKVLEIKDEVFENAESNIYNLRQLIIGEDMGKGKYDPYSIKGIIKEISDLDINNEQSQAQLIALSNCISKLTNITSQFDTISLKSLLKNMFAIDLYQDEVQVFKNIINILNETGNVKNIDVVNILTRDIFTPLLNLNAMIMDGSDLIEFSVVNDFIKEQKESFKIIDSLISAINGITINDSTTNTLAVIHGDIFEAVKVLLNDIYEIQSHNDTRDILNSLATLVSGFQSIEDFINKIDEIITVFNGSELNGEKFGEFIDALQKSIANVKESIAQGTTLNSFAEIFIIRGDSIKDLDESIKTIKNIITIVNEVSEIAKLGPALEKSVDILKKFGDSLKVIVDSFSKVDEAQVEATIKLLKTYRNFVIFTTAIFVIGAMFAAFIDWKQTLVFFGMMALGLGVLLGGMWLILTLVDKTGISADRINALSKLMLPMTLAVGMIGALLIATSYVGDKLTWSTLFKAIGALIGGVVLLTLGMIGLGFLMKFTHFDELTVDINQLMTVVGMAAAVLILGAFVSQMIPFAALMSFALSLGTFVILLGIALIPMGIVGGEMMDSAKELGKLLFYATGALLIGALFMYIPGIQKNLEEYTKILGWFIVGIMVPFIFFHKSSAGAMKGAESLGKLVLISSLVLMVGALFVRIPGIIGDIILFGVILATFNTLILLPYIFMSRAGAAAMKGAEKLAILVGVSGLILMFGAWIMDKYGFLPILGFALVLGLFIAGVTWAYTKFAKKAAKALAAAWQFSILIGVTALALTLGPILLDAYLGGGFSAYAKVFLFGLLCVGFVFAMGAVVKFLGKIGLPTLGKGILAVVAIGLIALGMAWVFGKSYEMIKDIDWEALIDGFIQMGKVMGAIGAIMLVIGGLTEIPLVGQLIAGAALAGGAILAGIIGIIWELAKAAEASAHAIKAMDEIKNVDVKEVLGAFTDFISSSIKSFAPFMLPGALAPLIKGSAAAKMIGKVISEISKAIKEYAELKVAVYDDKGKTVGYRRLTEQDFTEAATNIGLIITCVGGAIMGLFGVGPFASTMNADQKEIAMEMMKVESGGIFRRGKTKFALIIEAVKGLGDVISEIADGIKDYAALKMPKYDKNGKIIGYRNMNERDFEAAANSISTVITTIGKAIIDVYYGRKANIDPELSKEMFQRNWWKGGQSPFNTVVTSLTYMGMMLDSIVTAIQSYANLRIPEEWDPKTGKPTKWKKMGDEEFKAAGENIAKVITELGKAVIETANSAAFTQYYNLDKTKKIFEVINAAVMPIALVGNLLAQYATLKFPTQIDQNGNITRYVKLKAGAIEIAVNNMKYIMRAFAEGVLEMTGYKGGKTDTSNPLYIMSDYYHTAWGNGRSINDQLSDLVGIVGLIGNAAEALNSLVDKSEKIKASAGKVNDYYLNLRNILGINKEGKQSDTIFGLVHIVNLFYKDLKNSGVNLTNDDLVDDMKEISENFDKLTNHIVSIVKNIIKLNIVNTLNELTTDKDKSVYDTAWITDLGKLIENIKTISITKEDLELLNNTSDFVDWYVALIKNIDEISQNIDDVNMLRDSMVKLFETISNVKPNRNFGSHTKNLKTFIAATNNADIKKINSLTNLIDAINQFGKNFGSIDEFANTVVEKLSAALEHFASELHDAQTTINNADKLHKSRKKLIDDSIKELQKIMKQELTVNLKGEPTSGGTPPPTPKDDPLTSKFKEDGSLKDFSDWTSENTHLNNSINDIDTLSYKKDQKVPGKDYTYGEEERAKKYMDEWNRDIPKMMKPITKEEAIKAVQKQEAKDAKPTPSPIQPNNDIPTLVEAVNQANRKLTNMENFWSMN